MPSSTLTLAYFDASNALLTVNTLSGVVSSVSGNVSTLSGVVFTVSGNLDTLSGKVDTLSGNVTTLSGAISTISGSIVTLSGAVATLSGSVATLSGNVVDVQNAINRVKWTLKTTAQLTPDILSNSSNFLVLVDSASSSDGYSTSYSALQSATPAFQGGQPDSNPGSNYIRIANISGSHKYQLTLDGVVWEIAPRESYFFFFNSNTSTWYGVPSAR